MGLLTDIIDKLIRRRRAVDPDEVANLRLDFKERYRNFQQLLAANNQALETMGAIEQALAGPEPFGMTFIRSSCTRVSVNVFRMIRKIDLLAPDKYAQLFERFEQINQRIESLLAAKKPLADQRLLMFVHDIDKSLVDVVGAKMANLGEIERRLGLQVPDGFALTAAAYRRFMEKNDLQTEIDRLIQAADKSEFEALVQLSADIHQLILNAEVPEQLKEAVEEAWGILEHRAGRRITVALRSSAVSEDLAAGSFAGQYRSELNVSAEGFFEAYKSVLASNYSLPAITYRLNRGYRDEDIPMCVGCLVMVDAVSGGVTYSRDPVNVHDEAVFVCAAWGLPKSVVDGSDVCDEFVITRTDELQVLREKIHSKQRKYVCYPEEGVCRMTLTGDDQDQPAISRELALQLARIAIRLENHYGSPQDVEWCVDSQGRIYILQCRPLQTVGVREVTSVQRTNEERTLARGGVTASPGVGYGPVFIADKGSDILAFPEKAVLVVHQALPRWAPLLSRAAALVTEKGSFVGHLANVAREFDVPAIFGLDEAAALLPPGDTITVDATARSVYAGKVEDLLGKDEGRKHLMAGSPVYSLLAAVSKHIVPLNLIDPDGPEFHPRNCNTLHDITRFIHEKSVQEMFRFGKEHHFSERSSKRLHYKVPMHWWILNLDDGFAAETSGRYVKLENIVSIPMRALWRGFTAFPWEGPPAPDGKGMLSVMFRATADPSLAVGVRSKYSERNYFMISKHFCSLTSRMGFHFATLEALVGDRLAENYIRFQFEGGAADIRRRHSRVQFIAELLEELTFRVTVKQDHLDARLENQELDFMLKRLEVLGHLILHTRQLDVIMANTDQVQYYRATLKGHIDAILAACARPDDLTLNVCPAPGADDASQQPTTTSS